MDENPITKRYRLTFLDRPAPILRWVFFKFSPAEGICSQQAVTARHPGCRMPETLRTVEDRNAQILAADRAIDIDPIGRLSPNIFLSLGAGGVHHVTGRQTEFVRQANCERSLF